MKALIFTVLTMTAFTSFAKGEFFDRTRLKIDPAIAYNEAFKSAVSAAKREIMNKYDISDSKRIMLSPKARVVRAKNETNKFGDYAVYLEFDSRLGPFKCNVSVLIIREGILKGAHILESDGNEHTAVRISNRAPLCQKY